jgi:hypothetical protein
MAMTDKLNQYKEFIILAGFGAGILHILDFLPITISTLGLNENIKYVYIGIILIAVYCFHTFYWGKGGRSPQFQRTVTSRNLSNPDHIANLTRQRGTSHNYTERPIISPVRQNQIRTPSDKIFQRFREE